MQWRGGNCLRFAKQKGRRGAERPSRNKKAAAEQKAAAGIFSRGGLYCDIEFLSVPYLTIA